MNWRHITREIVASIALVAVGAALAFLLFLL